jgi:hypothetical protein
VTTADLAAFWIDCDYDRENASDGVSRFGAYVRNASTIAESWQDTWDDAQVRQTRFAAAAWEVATTPVMSPGYVRRHPRVIGARVEFNAWDATLTGAVELVAPWPESLARSRDWQHGTWWQDWPVESLGVQEVYREPGEDELAAHAYLMARATLQFPLRPPMRLPSAPAGLRDCADRACEAVEALVIAMNAAVTPVIRTLERS